MENMNEKFDEKLTDVMPENENLPSEPIKSPPLYKRAARKVKSAVVAVGTRTIVVVCSVLLIGLAVILNYVLADTGDVIDSLEPVGEMENGDSELSVPDTYFASSMLSREQARDEAIEVLKTVVNNEAALEDAKEAALTDIARIAGEIECEANIETLIKSKGFEDCIAVVTGSNANIIVKSDGLMENELSQIKEIVYEQAGIDPVNIKIVEKN
ncbi:MAG: SpoIIIAH-like family protein [Clostridia bacterium]|nr:SpoIIIAH-like family protein [Clostridia bacterium]